MKKQGCEVTVENCGFFISTSHGFIGASPDRIIHVHTGTQSSPGVLEMKYIQVKVPEMKYIQVSSIGGMPGLNYANVKDDEVCLLKNRF